MERSFKGIWIPKEIWLNKELKVMEKLFLVEIDSLDNEEGCFASNDYFSNFFDLSKNRCSEIIKSLERKGLITISYKYKEGSKAIEKRILKVIGKPNTPIRNTEVGIRNIDSPIRNIDSGYSENCEDNNINNNNINNNIISIEYIDLTFVDSVIDAVRLTQKQYDNLVADYGVNEVHKKIISLDYYITEKNKTYKDHNKTIRNWFNKEGIEKGKYKEVKTEQRYIRRNSAIPNFDD